MDRVKSTHTHTRREAQTNLWMRAPLNGVGRGSDRCCFYYYVDYCVLPFIFLFLNFARSFIFCSSVLVRYLFFCCFLVFVRARFTVDSSRIRRLADATAHLCRSAVRFVLCVCLSLSPTVCVRTENGERELGKESARNECVCRVESAVRACSLASAHCAYCTLNEIGNGAFQLDCANNKNNCT